MNIAAIDPGSYGKVAVLCGGFSDERDISLLSGKAVLSALQKVGVDAEQFDTARQQISELQKYACAFIVLHGRKGEDGAVQGALELMGIPYTGSGVLASSLSMDKWRSRLLWESIGLPMPAFELLHADSDFTAIEARLGLPIFVKPCREGSSIGISKVKRRGDLSEAYTKAAACDSLVIAEAAICWDDDDQGIGGEYTVSILNDQALPIVKIIPATEFYDYDAKYFRDDTRYVLSPDLPPALVEEIKRQALQAYRLLGCEGWGRVDFLMDDNGRHYWLEMNTLPGMTSHSLVPMAAAAAGISFEQLVLSILHHGVHKEVNNVA